MALPNGDYKIQNVANAQYVYLPSATKDQPLITAFSGDDALKWKLNKDSAGKYTISNFKHQQFNASVASGALVGVNVVANNNPTTWEIVAAPTVGRYYIKSIASGEDVQALYWHIPGPINVILGAEAVANKEWVLQAVAIAQTPS